MSVHVLEGLLPAPIQVEGQGIDFTPEADGGVTLEVSYPDGTRASPRARSELYITIDREDWEAIVAHVSREGGR
jgi:hypothetical protein